MLIDSIRAALFGAAPAARAGEGGRNAPAADPLHLAACALLLEVAYADGEFSAPEREHLERVLATHFSLPPETGRALLALAEQERRGSIDHFRFTSVLRDGYDVEKKMALAESMWGLVLADGQVAEHEHYLTRKIANLLDLEPASLSAAKAVAARARES